ncbi:hypothetical protein GCM10023264_24340 [Sphingomonas daechungensis]|uniref:hypothetical protein n=1 Tax=Sphingomonas daechungensis TaxID=1176646 RepID=UPI0029500380|nr:hypothetical protein [Sphingomonas daechungensis]
MIAMLKKVGRLFTIKTRTEAWLVTYAIAVGAVERARHYLELYPGNSGVLLAIACTGVVFIAGAKLLDSVRPVPAVARVARITPPLRRQRYEAIRNRPRLRPTRSGSGLRSSLHTD